MLLLLLFSCCFSISETDDFLSWFNGNMNRVQEIFCYQKWSHLSRKECLASYRHRIVLVCTGNSMIICSDIWHYNHDTDISKLLYVIWDNFEISRVIFMPNITYKSSYYLFILLPAKRVCNFHMYRYFKLSWNATALSQSNRSYFSYS